MKIARILCFLALVCCGALADAHTHLEKAVPADGSTVTVMPPNFVLTFAKPARVTAMALQKGVDAKQKLAPLPTAASREVSVAAPKLTPGKYVLSFVAVSDDGHVMPGKVSFTVAPATTGTAPGATG